MTERLITNEPPRPIFIIGAPRSGTSITTWALGQHPNIQPMPETTWLATLAIGAYNSFAKGSERERYSHLSNVSYEIEPFMEAIGTGAHQVVCDAFEKRCQMFYGDYRKRGKININPNNPNRHMQIRRSVDDPKQRWVDGTPLNTQFTHGLKLLFPEARFLHLLRRPEEVAASLMKFETVGAQSQSAKQGLRTWGNHTHFAVLAQQAWGTDAVLTVTYDDLIGDKSATFAKIATFLGEQPCDDCLLPMSARINSSEVDDVRAGFIDQIKRLRGYADAAALYNKALVFDVSETERARSAAELKGAFVAHCSGVRLI